MPGIVPENPQYGEPQISADLGIVEIMGAAKATAQVTPGSVLLG
jgi:hypothetical protein